MSIIQNKIDRVTDILRRDDGISGAMHYTEQISWILFLKFLSNFEINKAKEASKLNEVYHYVICSDYRWENWACPLDKDEHIDSKQLKTGTELIKFVNDKLFPYFKEFKSFLNDPKTINYKIGAIFEYLDNRIVSGDTLREILNIVNTLDFQNSNDLFELSHIYENLLKGMGTDGGNSGEFYTPRAIIKAMVETINPKVGETIYDGALGSAGFLVEAFEFMTSSEKKEKLSKSDWDTIHFKTFYGQEKTSLGYVMGMMNLILHGIEGANIIKGNTLAKHTGNFQKKDSFDIILANPPFGGKEKLEVQQNFSEETNATEMLFIQHFMKTLKSKGRAAIIIPEGVLFQTNNSFKKIKQNLLKEFNVHTIVSLPSGVFLPYSAVKTNILYFENNGPTSNIWYYEVNPEKKLTKNKPITYQHMYDFIQLFNNPNRRNKTNYKTIENKNDWTVSVHDIIDYDLSAKNPNKITEIDHLSPNKLLNKIKENDLLIADYLLQIEMSGFDIINKEINYFDYEEIALKDLIEDTKNVNPSVKYSDEIITYVDISSINSTNHRIEDPKKMKGNIAPTRARKSIQIGDIIFATTRPNLKNVAIVSENYKNAIASTGFCILRTKRNMLDNEFLFYYLISEKFQENILPFIKGAQYPAISDKDLLNIKIKLPSLNIQINLVDKIKKTLNAIQIITEYENKKIANLNALKNSLLHQTFK